MAPRALARKPEQYTPLVVRELAQIEADLGGRGALVGMLALAPLTPDLRYVLGLLGDPLHQSLSLAEICARGNLLPGDLLTQLSRAALLKGKVLAGQQIAKYIGPVTEDILRRAAPYDAPCNGGCGGTGSITLDPTPVNPNPSPQPCMTCRGTGTLRYQPDLERQKLAVELAQLLPKGGGIQIAQINGAAPTGSGGQGVLEKLQAVTDQLLYGPADAPPIEVEVTPAEEPDGQS